MPSRPVYFIPGHIEGLETEALPFGGVVPAATAPAYSVTNLTTDRAYDANATTVAELADVLGTLIADLRAQGIVQ